LNQKNGSTVLSIRDVYKYFGGIKAVDGISFDVARGCITALIGPNGAGKTTLFNLISGYYRPDSGEIHFDGERIDGLGLHQTFRRGLCRTFQISRELKLMTVLENLMLVPAGQDGEKLWKSLFFPGVVRRQEREIRDRAVGILDEVGLGHLRSEYAGNLSGGQKRLLELARAMMADPKMILFDEPGAGVNPSERKTLADRIRQLVGDKGISVLLIGHEMELVMDVCNPIIVMERGKKLTEGTPDQVRNDRRVLEVYLGGVDE
jgi:branched-chain amino acid transport system ATP-binding protein